MQAAQFCGVGKALPMLRLSLTDSCIFSPMQVNKPRKAKPAESPTSAGSGLVSPFPRGGELRKRIDATWFHSGGSLELSK
jgi:hypothetical protein